MLASTHLPIAEGMAFEAEINKQLRTGAQSRDEADGGVAASTLQELVSSA